MLPAAAEAGRSIGIAAGNLRRGSCTSAPSDAFSQDLLGQGGRTAETLERLRRGLALRGVRTRPAGVRLVGKPKDLWRREPPIRHGAAIATAWLEMSLPEAGNRRDRSLSFTL